MMVVHEQLIIERRPLNVSILGGFHASDINGRSLRISNRKACAIIAYLALHPNNSESRERLVGLLWSDKPEEQARASLRQTVKQIKNILETFNIKGFEADRQFLSVDPSACGTDVALVYEQMESLEINPILNNSDSAPERILYGFEALDVSFGSWLHVTRQGWQDKIFGRLEACIEEKGSTVARAASEVLANFDPTHEQAQRYLISDQAKRGNTAAALRQYEALWNLLDEEYDAEPDEETQALIVEIKSGNFAERQSNLPLAQTDQVLAKAVTPTIFVKQSETFPAMEQHKYLVDGFRREFIASLVRFREWVTIDGAFRDDHRMASDDTPVYEIDASVIGDLANPKMLLMLKDLSTRQTIWSETIQLALDSWLSVQSILVRRMAIALNVHLSASRLERFAAAPELSLDVYDRWLKGQDLIYGFTPEKWQIASGLFDSVIEEEMEFAPVYSSMAQMKNAAHLMFPGVMSEEENHRRALELGKKAIQVDPLDTRGHLSMGWSYAMLGQYEKSEISYALAAELNENDPWTMVSSALGWGFLDHPETSIKMANEALRLSLSPSPFHWSFQATIRFLCGDYEGSVEAAEKSNYSIHNIAAWKASALVHLGELEAGREACREFRDLVKPRWKSEKPPTDDNISEWLLSCFPIKNKTTRAAFQSGLNAAGLSISQNKEVLHAG